MTALPTTTFEQALVASGLVPVAKVHALRTASKNLPAALIEQGLLSAWQVDQLSQGRTKFSLGPYQILDSLGKGGMGYVFKARHALLGRIDAVKVLPSERSRSEAIDSFLREIRAQSQLDHPNIVRVSYADRDSDTYYFVTEYVPGIDLRRLIRRAGPLPVDVAANILLDVCEALEYAHRRGVVHRDVKPGNVLVTTEGRAKLTDLGLAWHLDDHPEIGEDEQRKVVGTCDYLAPEAVQQPTSIMPVSDVYSLGCTLYYALTGKVPYPGGNAREKLRRLVREEPIAPQTLRPDLPEPMVALVAQFMQKDHDLRTPSAAAAGDALREFVLPTSEAEVGDFVRRFEHRPAEVPVETDIEDLATEDTVDEPLFVDPLSGKSSQGYDEALQATEPLASADQQTEPVEKGDRTSASSARGSATGQSKIDMAVWLTALAALIATTALIASAIWRNL